MAGNVTKKTTVSLGVLFTLAGLMLGVGGKTFADRIGVANDVKDARACADQAKVLAEGNKARLDVIETVLHEFMLDATRSLSRIEGRLGTNPENRP